MNKFQKMRKVLEELNELPIYIAGHIKPDQDSICSCLALAKFLKNKGKSVFVLLKSVDENIIDWQGKSEVIVNEIIDKDYNFIALDFDIVLLQIFVFLQKILSYGLIPIMVNF